MDKLGQRIISDRASIAIKRQQATKLEQQAKQLRSEADEIERLLDLARIERT